MPEVRWGDEDKHLSRGAQVGNLSAVGLFGVWVWEYEEDREVMMDECDLGRGHADFLERVAIKAARGVVTWRESAEVCEECGEPIPEARRKAVVGCRYCVVCQENFEVKGVG